MTLIVNIPTQHLHFTVFCTSQHLHHTDLNPATRATLCTSSDDPGHMHCWQSCWLQRFNVTASLYYNTPILRLLSHTSTTARLFVETALLFVETAYIVPCQQFSNSLQVCTGHCNPRSQDPSTRNATHSLQATAAP